MKVLTVPFVHEYASVAYSFSRLDLGIPVDGLSSCETQAGLGNYSGSCFVVVVGLRGVGSGTAHLCTWPG